MEKIDGSGMLQSSLNFIAIDIADRHTDRECVLFLTDSAHFAIRQTPTQGSPSPLFTAVTHPRSGGKWCAVR